MPAQKKERMSGTRSPTRVSNWRIAEARKRRRFSDEGDAAA
jgi:hypothetical protein